MQNKEISLEKNNKLYFIKKWSCSDVGLAIVINLFFLILVLLFCDLKYEVSDDFVMASILSGAYGDSPNPQMIFVNVIIGYLLTPFYKLFPQTSWYFIFQLVVIFFSSITISYLLMKREKRPIAVMLSVLLIIFFTNDAYILMQFTKTAMFAVMSGSLLFVYGLFHSRKWIEVLYGGGLCLLGTCIRFSTIYIAGGFLVFILAFELFRFIKEIFKNREKCSRFLLNIICGGILIILAFGLKQFDWYTYNNDEAHGYFYEYNRARSQIVDSPNYGYAVYAAELENIGISENDYNMLKNWDFADTEFFTLEKMQQVAKIIRNHHKNMTTSIEELFERIQDREIVKYPVFMGSVLLLFLGFFLNSRQWWIPLGSLGIGIMYLFYFSYRERSIYRIEYAIFLGVFLCGVYFWNSREKAGGVTLLDTGQLKKQCAMVIAVCCLANIVLYIPDNSYKKVLPASRKQYIENTFWVSWNYSAKKYRKVTNKNKPQNELLLEINRNKQNFYFMDFNTTIQTLYFEYSPWEALPTGYYDNFIYMSGVTSNTPDTIAILEKNNTTNPLKDLVKDNVYLIDNHGLEMKLTYLREHYYPDVWAELYKEIDGYQVWKIYEK